MNILSVSDVVVKELVEGGYKGKRFPPDLIIACGDLPPEYLYELRNKYEVPLFYILGNHDIRHTTPPTGCTNLTGKIISHNGYSFLGFSGSRWYNGNQHQYREHQMRSQIRKLWFRLFLLKRLDVVVTHAPPRRIHDKNDRCHRGFNCYHSLIKRHSPHYFIHGHIHQLFDDDADRITVVGNTNVINSYGFYTFTL